jgi:hypothetical protein
MALTNYTQLQTAIQDYLDDETMNARVPDFITLFEAKARRALTTSDTVGTSVGTTTSDGKISLPTDFSMVRRVHVNGLPLDYITAEDAGHRNSRQSGRSTYAYSLEGKVLTVVPPGIVDVTLVYSQTVPALSGTNPTNWILDAHPDAYLYGALSEAEGYGFDDPRLAMWKALANDALGQIIGADQGTEWASAATLSPDPVLWSGQTRRRYGWVY